MAPPVTAPSTTSGSAAPEPTARQSARGSSRTTRRTAIERAQAELIADAAANEFRRSGVRSASIDRIARNAGVSRSTVYRRFPGKDELLATVIMRLRRKFVREMNDRLEGLDPAAAFVEAFTLSVMGFRGNDLVKRILEDQPEVLEMFVGFDAPQVEQLLAEFTRSVMTMLREAGATMPEEELRLAAETHFRLVASFATTPAGALDLDDKDAVRAYADKFLAPMIW